MVAAGGNFQLDVPLGGAVAIFKLFPEEQMVRLERALIEAGVDHAIETYPGARRGFAIEDLPVFDHGAAERHRAALFELVDATLAREGRGP